MDEETSRLLLELRVAPPVGLRRGFPGRSAKQIRVTDVPRNISARRNFVGHVEDMLGSAKKEDDCEKIPMIPEAQGLWARGSFGL